MIQEHHMYRLADSRRQLASAAFLRDAHRIAEGLFNQDPKRRSIDVLLVDRKGVELIETIQRPLGMIMAEMLDA